MTLIGILATVVVAAGVVFTSVVAYRRSKKREKEMEPLYPSYRKRNPVPRRYKGEELPERAPTISPSPDYEIVNLFPIYVSQLVDNVESGVTPPMQSDNPDISEDTPALHDYGAGTFGGAGAEGQWTPEKVTDSQDTTSESTLYDASATDSNLSSND